MNWVHDFLSGIHRIEKLAGQTSPDLIIANSDYTLQSVRNVFPSIPTEVLHYSVVDPFRLHRQAEKVDSIESKRAVTRKIIRESLMESNDTIVVLQVSRMEAWKGHGALLAAMSQIQSKENCVLWIVGGSQRPEETVYERQLRNKARELGLSHKVKFLGHRIDVPDVMLASDIFCQPNKSPEPFGIVFIESLYAGLPVVSFNCGGAAEIIDSTCGILVPVNDEYLLTKALSELVQDRALREELSKAGPARAMTLCNPVIQIRQLESVLSKHFESI